MCSSGAFNHCNLQRAAALCSGAQCFNRVIAESGNRVIGKPNFAGFSIFNFPITQLPDFLQFLPVGIPLRLI